MRKTKTKLEVVVETTGALIAIAIFFSGYVYMIINFSGSSI